MRRIICHFGPIGVLAALLCITSTTQAALSNNFTNLRTELSDRLGILSNSTDAVELTQAKACLKALTLLDKDPSLAGDIKGSYKVTKILSTTFPDEFATTLTGTLTYSNNVLELVFAGYVSIANQLTALLNDIQLTINSLPESKERDNAQAATIRGTGAMAAAFTDGLALTTKQFGSCLKSINKAQKIIDKVTAE